MVLGVLVQKLLFETGQHLHRYFVDFGHMVGGHVFLYQARSVDFRKHRQLRQIWIRLHFY